MLGFWVFTLYIYLSNSADKFVFLSERVTKKVKLQKNQITLCVNIDG